LLCATHRHEHHVCARQRLLQRADALLRGFLEAGAWVSSEWALQTRAQRSNAPARCPGSRPRPAPAWASGRWPAGWCAAPRRCWAP